MQSLRKNLHWSYRHTTHPRIFLSAGEASGDHYGAQLITELRRRLPQLTCFVSEARRWQTQAWIASWRRRRRPHGHHRSHPPHAPRLWSYRSLIAAIRQRRPHVAVLIDFPDVNFRLARELKKLDIPVIYFVSPQLWPETQPPPLVQQRVTRMMVIFHSKSSTAPAASTLSFVGHPWLSCRNLPSPAKEYRRESD